MATAFARTRFPGLATAAMALSLAILPATVGAQTAATGSAPAPAVTVAAAPTAAPAPAAPAAPTVTPKAAAPAPKVTYTDAKCTTFKLGGTPPNQTLVCQ